MGKKGYEIFNNINKEKPKELNKSFIDSGNIYIRSDFDENASFTYVKNGTLGSGHGHADLGHFSLYYNGEAFFVDSGRYTYLETDMLREYLKRAKAHNVSIIDGDPFAVPKKSWQYDKYADSLKNYFNSKDNISYAETPYLAKLSNGTNYIAIRKVLFISPNIWMIVNDIRCNGHHYCENYYNLDYKVKLEKYENYFLAISKDSKLRIYNYNVDSVNIKNSYISENYNVIYNSKRIQTRTEFKDFIRSYDVIIGENIKEDIVIKDSKLKQINNSNDIDDNRVIVKTIELGKSESYTIIIFNEETYKDGKLYFYNDTPVYGKVVVIHEVDEKRKSIRLRG